jgi:hypothetical protein
MCLHSGSTNRTISPRYVYFQSYCTRDADYLLSGLKGGYMNGSEEAAAMESLACALPRRLHFLLDSRRAKI